ncbi:MAG: hypothetical protein ACKOF9_07240, partial [Burkholderiales bacterium]
DPIPFSHPPTRHHLRHGSVQHGLPAAMCTCADSGLGGAADKRYLLDGGTLITIGHRNGHIKRK